MGIAIERRRRGARVRLRAGARSARRARRSGHGEGASASGGAVAAASVIPGPTAPRLSSGATRARTHRRNPDCIALMLGSTSTHDAERAKAAPGARREGPHPSRWSRPAAVRFRRASARTGRALASEGPCGEGAPVWRRRPRVRRRARLRLPAHRPRPAPVGSRAGPAGRPPPAARVEPRYSSTPPAGPRWLAARMSSIPKASVAGSSASVKSFASRISSRLLGGFAGGATRHSTPIVTA